MPKAERKRKDNSKALSVAASKPGQSKLTDMFCNSSRNNSQSAKTQPAQHDIGSDPTEEVCESGSRSHKDFPVDIGEAWVKRYEDFSEQDREESERNGRFFIKDWFKRYEWLFYNRDRKKSFCTVCTSQSTKKGNFNFNCGDRRVR